MSEITRFPENKTTYILCDCHSEILYIEYDQELNIADLAIYTNHYASYGKMSIYQKIRYIWQVLVYGRPYSDQIVLSKSKIKELGQFLLSISK